MEETCVELKNKIAWLKETLYEAMTDERVNSGKVLEVSQELDQIINKYLKAASNQNE